MQFSFSFAHSLGQTHTNFPWNAQAGRQAHAHAHNNIEQGKSACFASCHNFVLFFLSVFKFINMEKVLPLCATFIFVPPTISNTNPTSDSEEVNVQKKRCQQQWAATMTTTAKRDWSVRILLPFTSATGKQKKGKNTHFSVNGTEKNIKRENSK